VFQFPCKSKENYEYGNITFPDGMKSYDALGSAISVWTVTIENIIEIGLSGKI
jgi:hypothetical protein